MERQRALFRPAQLLLVLLTVFFVSLVFFLFLQTKPVFPDPDSFYHIKVSQLIAQQGVVESFPWLTYTPLARSYTDQHFLYHVFLAPFTTLINPVAGVKFATSLVNAALLTLFSAFLIRFRVRLWPVFVVILLVTNPFLFRINLVKAPGVSVILLLTGLWLVARGKWLPLAFLAFLYAWTYGGFVLLGLTTVLFAVVAALHRWHGRSVLRRLYGSIIPPRFRMRAFVRSPEGRLGLAAGIGTVAGVLIHPYFPGNLSFYWQQLVQIGIINFQKVVNVGGEWHPYGFIELISNTVFVSIAILLAVLAFAIHRRRQTPLSWTLFLLTVFFFLITLKSRRYVELYVPFATLFAAVAIRDALPVLGFRRLVTTLTTVFFKRTALVTLLAVYILAATLTVIIRDTTQLKRDLEGGFRADYLQGVGRWLAQNTAKGSIVVHSDWDEFPMLFYHNTHNRYIVGLDPTFMYQEDRVLYERWADLTQGRRADEATKIITGDLGSSTVVVTKDHEPFNRVMRAQSNFSLEYEDRDAWVYQLVAP